MKNLSHGSDKKDKWSNKQHNIIENKINIPK